MQNTIHKLKGCAKVVAAVLSNDPSARDNDRTLVRLVWENYGLFLTDDQAELFFSKKLPTADTITRAGRKLRQENAHLRGSDKAQAVRSRNEQETQQRMPSTTITPSEEPKQRRLFGGFGRRG